MSNQIGQNDFRPQPGRFGVMPQVLTTGPIGGTNFLGGANPLTANATNTFYAGAPPARSMFSRLAMSCVQVPADADGTILASAWKYDASADAAVQLTDTFNLESLVTREGSFLEPLSTATAAQLTFEEGDTLEIRVVSNSAAINTQPSQLVFNAEVVALQ